ncbi:MAG: hypothetical protein M3Y77_04695, partial [Actinomycetota bacterium]|nr:hypothetical protein [Actinomycetota bacterium]
GAMLGVAAHLVNVLPDLRQDALSGIRGLPHRIGTTGSTIGAALLVMGAAAALLFGPTGAVPAWRWIAFGVLLAAGIGTAGVVRRPGSRLLFSMLIVGAAIDVVLFAFSGTHLVSVG